MNKREPAHEKESRRTELLAALRDRFPDHIVNRIDWPEPYCVDYQEVSAIVLGCDPTAFDSNGQLIQFKVVFGIGGQDGRYFSVIEKNLERIGLHLSDIYVQNLCQNYFAFETAKNKIWQEAAQWWIEELKNELAIFPESIPILLTSESLYRVVLNPGTRARSARYLYSHPDEIPILPDTNRLQRDLVPLYRHWDYRLSEQCNKPYRARLMSLFQ